MPPNGLSSTFRSELGFGGGMATLLKANIKAPNGNQYNLLYDEGAYDYDVDKRLSELYVRERSLDGTPSVFQIYSKTRLWRLALNASVTSFNTTSRKTTSDGLFWYGLVMGGDLDFVQNEWLSVGVAANFYFNDPKFYFNSSSLDRDQNNKIYAEFAGSAPSNFGLYLRYTPPEILNFPVHVEAHYYIPLQGSKWTNWRLALAFRPQIYRFDVSTRLRLEGQYLKISGVNEVTNTQNLGSGDWDGDFAWSVLGIDFGVYF